MGKKKLCIYCHEREAKVPDRNNYTGRFIKKVCGICHQKLLRGDMVNILRLHKEQTK